MVPATTSSTCLRAFSPDRVLLAATADVIRRLMLQFPEMVERYPDRNAMVREWAENLADMRDTEIARGVAACRTRRFPPNIGDFALLCRPALDEEWAWYEAQRGLQARDSGGVGEWSHPAVFRAATAMSWELRTKTFAAIRRQWEMTLSREFAAGWGEEVPAPAPRIGNKPATRAISQEQRKELVNLAKTFASRGKK